MVLLLSGGLPLTVMSVRHLEISLLILEMLLLCHSIVSNVHPFVFLLLVWYGGASRQRIFVYTERSKAPTPQGCHIHSIGLIQNKIKIVQVSFRTVSFELEFGNPGFLTPEKQNVCTSLSSET